MFGLAKRKNAISVAVDLQLARQLDTICDDFENHWSAGPAPEFESYLQRVPASNRQTLLKMLVGIDVELQVKRGSSIDWDRYARFGSEVVEETCIQLRLESDAGSICHSSRPPETSHFPTIGNYEVLRTVGSGGMGEVYLARHARFRKRFYAIKVLKPGIVSTAAIKRFEQEIVAMGELAHPNLAFAIDAGQIDDAPYLVMEFVDGRNLQQILGLEKRLAIADACELARQACLGLQCAHTRNIIHRDVKPLNLMLDRDGQVKVLDLGLARLRESTDLNLTLENQVLGTADYMSPEQWSDPRNVTGKSDIYSIGCTLYFLLTGRPPFAGIGDRNLAAIMNAHLNIQPIPVRQIRPEISIELGEFIGKMLQKQPEKRQESIQQVAEELGPFCRDANLKALSTRIKSTHEWEGEHRPAMLPANKQEPDESIDSDISIVPRRLVTLVAITTVAASLISLCLSYFGPFTTETWGLRFDKLDNSNVPNGTGFAIEAIRSVLFLGLTFFVCSIHFSHGLRAFLSPNVNHWKVWLARGIFAVTVGFFLFAETTRHLNADLAPAKLAEYGIAHGIDTNPQIESLPYATYLPYTLINYAVLLGGLFVCPILYFLLIDFPGLKRLLADSFIDSNIPGCAGNVAIRDLRKFAFACRKLTARYIDVIGVLAIGIHFEFWVGRWTLSDEGMGTAAAGFVVVGLMTSLVVIIAQVFNQGFEQASRAVADSGDISSESNLASFNVFWFLKTTFIFRLGGAIFYSLIIIPIYVLFYSLLT